MINCGGRQSVTGIVVNDKINIASEYKRKLKQEMYYCQKYGVTEHAKRIGEDDVKKYLLSLLGRVSYALQVRPYDDCLKKYKLQIIKFIKEQE